MVIKGQLVDFFDPDASPSKLITYFKARSSAKGLVKAARNGILEGGYDLQKYVESQQLQLINQVMVADACDPIQCNSKGSNALQPVIQKLLMSLLRKAYRNLAPERDGILVNLGLALMQQGRVDQAERAYRLALNSDEQRVRRSAAKNLGFLLLWRGDHKQGWHWHGQRFEGESF